MRQMFRTRHDKRRRLRGLLPAALCLLACAPADAPAQDAAAQQEVRRAASCSGKRGKELFGMRFEVPKGMKSKKVTDVDYVLFYVYPKGNEKEYLELWSGPHVGGGSPEREVLESSTEVRRGEWQAEWNGGRDISGRARDGKRWRRTTMFMGLAVYENVSEETARRFDQIIDGMCSDVEYMKKFAGQK
jgi:hypothetical protein